jgi:hypothetical protein
LHASERANAATVGSGIETIENQNRVGRVEEEQKLAASREQSRAEERRINEE